MGSGNEDKVGLILTGGGARAAYQVGVLKGVAHVLPRHLTQFFPIIVGTSAGAINAAVLASYSNRMRIGLRRLETVWKNFHTHNVYRSDFRGVFTHVMRWSNTMMQSGENRYPIAMLDNRPLKKLLSKLIPLGQIEENISQGHLYALCIAASCYSTGESINFFQGAQEIVPWQRVRRRGVRTTIKLNHLMASSAMPLLFPSVRIQRLYYGDGSLRQLAPISPAIHLGAKRIFIIGLNSRDEPPQDMESTLSPPTIAEISGHMLDSAFGDALETDLERLMRINSTLSTIERDIELDQGRTQLKRLKVLTISPSRDLGAIAAKHRFALSPTLRFFFNLLGAMNTRSSSILSYLLFEPGYTRELIRLGYRDALAQAQEIREFYNIPS
tara:strand:- start:5324 stop:6475 length:1152 start_codon:yes stop_codon:yes gene_type:complete